MVLRHEFLERHHLEFVLRGHGRLQHHAIKKQKSPTWRGFVSNLGALRALHPQRAARGAVLPRRAFARRQDRL
ncbi:putative amino acid adenylation [Burkholderia mallei]|nr:putative amino acid adenylation [Burkholderia mallei]